MFPTFSFLRRNIQLFSSLGQLPVNHLKSWTNLQPPSYFQIRKNCLIISKVDVSIKFTKNQNLPKKIICERGTVHSFHHHDFSIFTVHSFTERARFPHINGGKKRFHMKNSFYLLHSNIFHVFLFSFLQNIEWVEISCKHLPQKRISFPGRNQYFPWNSAAFLPICLLSRRKIQTEAMSLLRVEIEM